MKEKFLRKRKQKEIDMKNKKKLLMTVAAVATMCTLSVASLPACGNDGNSSHQHNYENWTVTTPPTCTEQGVETGTCAADGATTTRPVAIDPDAHNYGDWTVSVKPTATAEGTATRVCANNASHVDSVTLPVLSEENYTVTVKREGIKTYTYKSDTSVSFDVVECDSVSQAANVAAANKSAVASGAVSYTYAGSYTYTDSYTYEYEEGYSHIVTLSDYGNTDEWFIEDGDEVTCFVSDYGAGFDGAKKNSNGDSGKIDGVALSPYALGDGYSVKTYGAEGLLSKLYTIATENGNDDLTETVVDGTYSFSFSWANTAASRYSEISVSFTLADDGSLATLAVEADNYDGNYNYTTWTTEPQYEENGETGKYQLKEGATVSSTETISFTQSTTPNEEGNPFDFDAIYIGSLTLTNGDATVTEGDTLEMTAGESLVLGFGYTPDTANFSLDEITVWKVYNDGVTPDTQLYSYYGDVTASVSTSDQTITFNSTTAGEYQIKVKTNNVTLSFVISVEAAPLTGLNSKIYLYNQSYQAKAWTTAEQATVYAGKPLCLYVEAANAGADGSYTVSVTSDNAANATLTAGTYYYQEGYQFVASAEGTYTVTFVATSNPEITKTVTVTVKATPTDAEMAKVLSGNYEGTVGNRNGTVNVEVAFTPASEGAANGTVTVKAENAYGSLVTDGTDTYTYSYADGTLTTTKTEGNGNGVQLRLSEDYQLEAYFESYGSTYSATLEAVTVVVPDLLTDTAWSYDDYTMTFTNGKMNLTVGNDSASAVYTLDETTGAITFSNATSTIYAWSASSEAPMGGKATIEDGKVTAVSIYLYDGTADDDVERTFTAKQADHVLTVGDQELTLSGAAETLSFAAEEDATYKFTITFIDNPSSNNVICIYTQDAYNSYGDPFVNTDDYTSNQLVVTAGQTYTLVLTSYDACTITITVEKAEAEETFSLNGITATGTVVGDAGEDIDVTLAFGNGTVIISTANGTATTTYSVSSSAVDAFNNYNLTIGEYNSATLGFSTGKGIVTIVDGEVTGISITVGTTSSNPTELTFVKAPDLKGYSGTATDTERNIDLTFTFGEDGSATCTTDTDETDSFGSVTLTADDTVDGRYNLTFADVQTNDYTNLYYNGTYFCNDSYVIVGDDGSVTLYLTLDGHDNPIEFTLTKA